MLEGTLQALLLLSFASAASAQDDSAAFRKSLFPNRLSGRVEVTPGPSRTFDVSRSLSLEDVVGSEVRDDGTINDTIVHTEQQRGAMTFVRNTFSQTHLDDVVSERASDALDFSNDAAQKLAMYEGALVITRALAASPLAQMYAEFSSNLRTVRNFLMFRVSPDRDGSIGFEPQSEYGKRTNLIEFRLSPSLQNGVEPRLRLGENVSMGYDFDEHAPMLEYDLNF